MCNERLGQNNDIHKWAKQAYPCSWTPFWIFCACAQHFLLSEIGNYCVPSLSLLSFGCSFLSNLSKVYTSFYLVSRSQTHPPYWYQKGGWVWLRETSFYQSISIKISDSRWNALITKATLTGNWLRSLPQHPTWLITTMADISNQCTSEFFNLNATQLELAAFPEVYNLCASKVHMKFP